MKTLYKYVKQFGPDNDPHTLDQIMTPEKPKLGPDNNFTTYIYICIYIYIFICIYVYTYADADRQTRAALNMASYMIEVWTPLCSETVPGTPNKNGLNFGTRFHSHSARSRGQFFEGRTKANKTKDQEKVNLKKGLLKKRARKYLKLQVTVLFVAQIVTPLFDIHSNNPLFGKGGGICWKVAKFTISTYFCSVWGGVLVFENPPKIQKMT